MKRKLLLAAVSLFALSGCAHVISDEGRKSVDPAVTFQELKQDPERQLGKNVILGGKIVGVKNTQEGSRLEIVQFPLDELEQPVAGTTSEGRFLAETKDFLDPAVYRKGMLVTVLGEVRGQRTLKFDETEYRYPVVRIKELHAWNEEKFENAQPRYYPGGYYDPFFYDHPFEPYWYSPFWYRPIGPPWRRW